MPCRINRRRIWCHRMMLESVVHEHSSFVTLTYKDMPANGSLRPIDLQLWLKKLRKAHPQRLRFFGVGEYGDKSERPHYHAAVFGLSPSCGDLVRSSWGLGHTLTGTLTMDSAQYVAGYVCKKMTCNDDARLNGRYPEFARMSLRPGIGAPAIGSVASALQNKFGWDAIGVTGDVPSMLMHGRKTLPLGRYMRSRLRYEMNFEELGENEEAAFKRSAKMLDMYKTFLLDTEIGAITGAPRYDLAKARKAEEDEQRVLNQASRYGMYDKRKGSNL